MKLEKEVFERNKRLGILKKNASWEKFQADVAKSQKKLSKMCRDLEEDGIKVSMKIGDGEPIEL